MVGPAKSITHQHILSVLNTELREIPEGHLIKVLDVGCGDGHLIGYMMKNLGILNPNIKIDVYGFDVSDHGVQSEGYFASTIEHLSGDFPDISWGERLQVISSKESWPYPDNFFDFVISNQVLEHINNHGLFFSEVRRTLRDGGRSVHLFPLKHYFYEGHLHLPLIHKILNHDLSLSYIKTLSRMGFGKFKSHNKSSGVSINDYAERHADYMCFFTNYLSHTEVLKLGKENSLRTSFRYTREFYTSKLGSVFGRAPKYLYRRNRSSFFDWLTFHILKYLSSITLVLHKRETYTKK